MHEDGLLSRILRDIEKEIDSKGDYIASGACQTLEDYRQQCGHRDGLLQAQAMIHNAVKRLASGSI